MAHIIKVNINYINQRIDNFLFRELKNVPKSLIYRLIRKGAIRVNKKRTKPEYKLLFDDEITLPVIHGEHSADPQSTGLDKKHRQEGYKNSIIKQPVIDGLVKRIVYDCPDFLILNKPSGMAVHAGSGVTYGVIDVLRKYYGEQSYIELVHRLDRDTSGCLLISKNRLALQDLHIKLQSNEINKNYLALVKGTWSNSKRMIEHPLLKAVQQGGERMVVVDHVLGKPSTTRIEIKALKNDTSLLQLTAVTGRTHQLRVHCAHEGHYILGDDKYGNKRLNQELKDAVNLRRIFLHAYTLNFRWGKKEGVVSVSAALDDDLQEVLHYFDYI